ncbi:MAG: pantetheine-phosphate adenylyltransferase [bacterium]
MKKAIYALSGDPFHKGHLDIIQRASRVFDEVVVAIGVNPEKQYLFSLTERSQMISRSVSSIPNVRVASFQGLLVDYAYEQGVDVIIKGVRSSKDMEFENLLHLVGESQELGIDTFVLFAKPELMHVASSTIKALQLEEGFIHHYVPLNVKQCLEARMSGQYILGITGEIGAGKSHVADTFVELARERGLPIHSIVLDDLHMQILEELQEPSYQQVRQEIVREFGTSVRNPDGTISRKNLGDLVYSDNLQLDKLNQIMEKALMVRVRRALRGKKGLILVTAALMAESKLTHLCNNNVVLATCDKASQERRLRQRGLTPAQIQRRLDSQYSEKEKRDRIQALIQEANQGRLWPVDSSDGAPQSNIGRTFDEVVQYFGLARAGGDRTVS